MIRYAITDRRSFPGDQRHPASDARRPGGEGQPPATAIPVAALFRQAAGLAASGVDFLQLREKDLPPADLRGLALGLRSAIPAGTLPRLLLNGPAELAAETGMDGVHLPGGFAAADLDAARLAFARAGLSAPVLSLSTHSLDGVRAARRAGASLILFGPIFEKRVAGAVVVSGRGLDSLAAAARTAAPTPLLALGGVTLSDIPACLAAGAAGVAGIRLFLPDLPRAPGSSFPVRK